MDDLQIVRKVLNTLNYHDLKALNLEFQDATGWQDLYGEFWFHVANSILGKHPNLLDRCKNWPNLEELHRKLSNLD